MYCGDFVVIQTLVQFPAVLLASCVTWGDLFGPSEAYLPRLGGDSNYYLQ